MPELPDGPTEDSTDRDGFLSYSAEWHAFSHGVYRGLVTPRLWDRDPPENPDIENEPHYYKGGYVIGTVLQVIVLVTAGTYGLTSL